MIDNKVREILLDAYKKAKNIITKYKDLHQKISTVLLEKEEIYREEFDEFFKDIKDLPEKNG
ncbi:TPA: hypothetical protein DEG21_05470 [Patescibacteria group bacterium]|nr:hypothetical protein [Candidatus Gracilibacteria bacterium]HBY75272.1 hypothetical protein [Candidatus Gracilibacteria bacterium]